MARPRPKDTLAAAVGEGIITQDQADAIRALKTRRRARDEPVTLVSNFSDVFLVPRPYDRILVVERIYISTAAQPGRDLCGICDLVLGAR